MTNMENRILSVTDRLWQRVTLAAKAGLSMGLCLLLGLILLGIAFQADQRSLTEQQLKTLGAVISQQTASSSAALILAGDTLSLSINLQQLVALTQIRGVDVVDPRGRSLAQVGQPGTLVVEQPVLSGETVLGSVRIHLNPDTDAYAPALPLTLAMGAVVLLLLLATTLAFGRHLSRPLQALLSATEQICTDNPIAPLDQGRHDELGRIARLLNQRFAEPVAEPTAEPAVESKETTAAAAPAIASEFSPAATASTEPLATESLAAPAIAAELSPEPGHQTASSEIERPLPIGKDKNTPDGAAPGTGAARGYLLYVNHHVGGSDTLTTTERQQLLVRYRKALEQVARLYKGGVSTDALGNWCVHFLPLANDQSHGINALCAAQLFNALYRGINAQAIRRLSPALNMKLVLLCGPGYGFDALAEDALVLSDKIQDNDLITHKALYQIPALQDRMLGGAKYRKYDDDIYLVSALNEDYQTLIDRQAEHFLRQSPG
ncbi:MAG: HAMP domain-containing protein [Motiliproteus sp.]|jgi:HAMP domain-containing protein